MSGRLSNSSRVIVFFFHLILWLIVQQLVMNLSQSTAPFLMSTADPDSQVQGGVAVQLENLF